MTTVLVPAMSAGVLFPVSVLSSGWFAVLAALVAINTVAYSALAVAKLLPRIYPGDWLTTANRRSDNRSIWPDHDQ